MVALEMLIKQLQSRDHTALSDVLKDSLTVELVGPKGEMKKYTALQNTRLI